MGSTSPTWSDVADYGREHLRQRWKIALDDPPVEVACEITVPVELTDAERDIPR